MSRQWITYVIIASYEQWKHLKQLMWIFCFMFVVRSLSHIMRIRKCHAVFFLQRIQPWNGAVHILSSSQCIPRRRKKCRLSTISATKRTASSQTECDCIRYEIDSDEQFFVRVCVFLLQQNCKRQCTKWTKMRSKTEKLPANGIFCGLRFVCGIKLKIQ